MPNATQILRIVVVAGDPLTATEIAQKIIPFRRDQDVEKKRLRKSVIKRLGILMSRDLVERARDAEPKQEAFGDIMTQARYRATDAGRDFVAAGKKITCARKDKTRRPCVIPGTDRQRFWSALRLMRKATLPAIVEAASRKGDDPARMMRNLGNFMRALQRAGIVVVLPVREPGHALTSNGFKRYALINDIGRIAPIVRKHGIFNPNNNEHIAYRDDGRAR